MFRAGQLLLLWVAVASGCAPEANERGTHGSQQSASLRDSAAEPRLTDGGRDAASGLLQFERDAAADAGPKARIAMGVNPVPADQNLLMDLDVVAFGSKVTTVVHRFGSGSSLETAIERGRWFEDQELKVLFAIDVAAGAADTELDLEERGNWVRASLDALFEAEVGVSGVVLGEALDLTLRELTATERKRFGTAVRSWLRYASVHPARSADLRVGVHTSGSAWLESSPSLESWLEWVEFASLSSHGLAEDGSALSLDAARAELDAQIAAADSYLPGVWIRELCYPSAAKADSSLEQQAQAYDTAWEGFAVHPERQPFVAISALYDPPRAECERIAATYGLPARAETALCSIGLKDDADGIRPAFSSVVSGMVTLGQP